MSVVDIRLGLVQPKLGGNVAFWTTRAPRGVEIEATELGYLRGDRETFTAGLERAAQLAVGLADRGCDLIVVSGTPPFLLEGLAFEREWRNTLSERIGRRVITGMEAHALALQALGASKVAVATYYGDELNQAIAAYLAHFDIEAILLGGFNLTGEAEALYSTPMQAQDGIAPEQVYEYCRRGVQSAGTGVDALYINGGGWDPAPIITKLEKGLHTNVVWGPVAEMWLTYWTLGVSNPQADLGNLSRNGHSPPLGT